MLVAVSCSQLPAEPTCAQWQARRLRVTSKISHAQPPGCTAMIVSGDPCPRWWFGQNRCLTLVRAVTVRRPGPEWRPHAGSTGTRVPGG